MKTADLPLVTVMMPIRNEARFIEKSLCAVIAQDYPTERMEILVVDGLSNDGTCAIVRKIAGQDPRIRLIENPERIVPTALNQSIRAARGSVLIRVDGHAIISQDYVTRCIHNLSTISADCVGGVLYTVGETLVARAIALAQSSRFGVGNAAFRHATTPQYVDTIAFGAYRREIFDRIGLFDAELVRNQDDELNFRLTRSGGRIWLDPLIHATYFSRSTLRGLWKQYYEYGFWKVRVIQKHKRPASLRHLVPLLFVVTLVLSFTLALATGLVLPVAMITVGYLVASLVASVRIAQRKGLRFVFLLPCAFSIMHFAYGLGFLVGMPYFAWRKRAPKLKINWGNRSASVNELEKPKYVRD